MISFFGPSQASKTRIGNFAIASMAKIKANDMILSGDMVSIILSPGIVERASHNTCDQKQTVSDFFGGKTSLACQSSNTDAQTFILEDERSHIFLKSDRVVNGKGKLGHNGVATTTMWIFAFSWHVTCLCACQWVVKIDDLFKRGI